MRHSRTREKIKVSCVERILMSCLSSTWITVILCLLAFYYFLLKKNKVSKLLLHVHSILFFWFYLFILLFFFLFSFNFYVLFINQVEIHTSNCIVFACWHWWNLITIPFMIKCLQWEPRSLMQYTLNNFHVIAEFDKFSTLMLYSIRCYCF